MAVFTGHAVGPIALLRAINTYLTTSCRYASRMSQDEGAGRRVHASYDALFANFMAFESGISGPDGVAGISSGIAMNLGTNYDVTKTWYAQPGTPVTNSSQSLVRTIAVPAGVDCNYWLIVENDWAFLAVEVSAGRCNYLGWGNMEKVAGAFTGGMYFFAENAIDNNSAKAPFYTAGSLVFRADVDTWTNKWICVSNGSSSSAGYTGRHAGCINNISGNRHPSYNDYLDHSTGTVDGVPVMLPMQVFVARDDGGYSHLGNLPNLYLSRRVPYPASASRGTTTRLADDKYYLFPGVAVRYDSPARAVPAGAKRVEAAMSEYRGKLLPSVQTLNGGAITGSKTTTMRLWNVSKKRESRISALNQPDVYGLTVTPPAPFTVLPGASKTVTVTVLASGKPVINDKVQFYDEAKGSRSSYVDARYYRALPFPLRPAGGLSERLAWPSTVSTSHSGKEQRASLATKPRRSISCTVSTSNATETALAEALLFQGQSRLFAAPRWTDARPITAAAGVGAMALSVDTSNSGFTDASFAVVSVSSTQAYIVEIASVGAGVLNLAFATQAAIPVGALIAPAMFSRIEAELGASVDLADCVDYNLTFSEDV